MSARKQKPKTWDGIGLFDLEAGLLLAVSGADPLSYEAIRAISKKKGGTIAPVVITIAPSKKRGK